jgi:hypothetical protein
MNMFKSKEKVAAEAVEQIADNKMTKLVESGRCGMLHLNIAQAAEVNPRPNPKLYATVSLGECRVQTHVDLENGSFPVWGQSFDLEVGDVTGDLVILIKDSHSVTGDRVVGRVVVPLTHLMTLRAGKKEASAWFQILPPAPGCRGGDKEGKVAATIPGLQGTGMSNREAGRGMLNLGLKLTLDEEKAMHYLKSTPFEVDRIVGDNWNPVELSEATARLTALFSTPSFVLALCELPVIAYTQCFWFYMCFCAADWFQPIAFVISLCWAGAMSAQYGRRYEEVLIWEEQLVFAMKEAALKDASNDKIVEKEEKKGMLRWLLDGTIGQVISLISSIFGVALGVLLSPDALSKVLNGITNQLEDTASLLEKLQSIFSWADPVISAIACIALFVAILPISLIFYFIPIDYIVWLIGSLVMFFPKYIQSQKDYAPQLEVCISHIRGLVSNDRDGLCDPFVKVTLDGAWGAMDVAKSLTFQTPTKFDTLLPEWDIDEDGDGRFLFPVELLTKETVLNLHLFDDDGVMGDDHVGTVAIPLFDLKESKRTFENYAVKKMKKVGLLDSGNDDGKGSKGVIGHVIGGIKTVKHKTVDKAKAAIITKKSNVGTTVGQMNVSLCWIDAMLPNKKPFNVIVIQHVAVWDLLAMDKTGIFVKTDALSDPYVTIEHGEGDFKQTQQTKVVNNALEATWDCELRFDIEVENMNYPLVIKVWDSDIDLDDEIGRREISLSDLVAVADNKAASITRQLRNSYGEIDCKRGVVRIECVYDMIESQEEVPVMMKKAREAANAHKKLLGDKLEGNGTPAAGKGKGGKPAVEKKKRANAEPVGMYRKTLKTLHMEPVEAAIKAQVAKLTAKKKPVYVTELTEKDAGRMVNFEEPDAASVRVALAAAGVIFKPEILGPMLGNTHRVKSVDVKRQLVTLDNFDDLSKGRRTVQLPKSCIAWAPEPFPGVGGLIKNFLARVPDKKEEIHRMVCAKMVAETYGRRGEGTGLVVLNTDHEDTGSVKNMFKKTHSKGAFFTFDIGKACEHLGVDRGTLEAGGYTVYMAHVRAEDKSLDKKKSGKKKGGVKEEERPHILARGRVVLEAPKPEKDKPVPEHGVGRWKAMRSNHDVKKYIDKWAAPKKYHGKEGWFQVGDVLSMCVLDDDLFAGQEGHEKSGPPRISDMEDDDTIQKRGCALAMKTVLRMKHLSTVRIQARSRGGMVRAHLEQQRAEAARLAEEQLQSELDRELLEAEKAANNPERVAANFEMMKMDAFKNLKAVST